jgi:hypothetical protein
VAALWVIVRDGSGVALTRTLNTTPGCPPDDVDPPWSQVISIFSSFGNELIDGMYRMYVQYNALD